MNPTFKIFAPMLKASMGPDGKMRLHGIASSTVKDRHGDTMTASALADMERSANNNLTIFLNHEYKVPEDVAGHVERASIRSHPHDPDIHDLAMDIVVNDKNERAVKAWEAIDGGTQLGLSIGAMIPEGGAIRDRKSGTYQIDHVELLETSLVGVPANPRSWVEYAVKSLNVTRVDDDAETGFVTRSDGEVVVVVEIDEEEARLVAEELAAKTEDPAEEPAPEETETRSSGGGTWTVLEPDTTNATVSVETPFANITVDTGNRGSKPANDGSSQEAQASVPENEEEDKADESPWAAIGLSGEPETTEPEMDLQTDLEPTIIEHLRTSDALLTAITRELIETKQALDAAIVERDLVVSEAEKAFAGMNEILVRLSATPLGRRAVVREASEQFASLKAVYDDDFLNLLKKG